MSTKKPTPQLKTLQLPYKSKLFDIEYFYRKGNGGQTILFVHGLGGAKENFWEACKADSLATHTLICFDNPGTGNSSYFDDLILTVDDLAAMTSLFVDAVRINNFVLVGASMGGLITLLYLQKGDHQIKGYVNIEGNLMPEDCMFSSKVVSFDYATFEQTIYPQTIVDMKKTGNTGYHIIANNLQLNTNIKSYYHYSFKTVEYSSTGALLHQYLTLRQPRLFIYGEENKNLSYLPQLAEKGMALKSISDSNHFVFYDNPKGMYDAIAEFINTL